MPSFLLLLAMISLFYLHQPIQHPCIHFTLEGCNVVATHTVYAGYVKFAEKYGHFSGFGKLLQQVKQ